LNIDYKIISKALALRVEKIISKLISEEQLAYIKGRFICEHIRTVQDIIEVYKSKEDGYLIFHDFEKAFDSIEWDFLYAALKLMNFPENFINLVKLLNNEMTGTVIVNSELTDFFKFSRGCRQGDPMSAYLFILGIEVFVSHYKVKQSSLALGLGSSKIPILLYADDTVTSHDSLISIKNCFSL